MDDEDARRRRFEEQLVAKRGVLPACVLILLDERPGHGYDLMNRLEPLGYDRSNMGRIYRALRWLETAGYVTHRWDTNDVGAARRVFELSEPGRRALEVAARSVHRHSESLDPALARYLQRRARAISSPTHSFELWVETTLAVRAVDETSARRKIAQLFGQPRSLHADIHSTGQL